MLSIDLRKKIGLDPPFRQYVPVSLRPGEIPIRASIHGSFGTMDGAWNCSVASLDPVLLVLTEQTDATSVEGLTFAGEAGRFLGELRLAIAGRCGPRREYLICAVTGRRNACVSWNKLVVNYLRYAVSAWRRPSTDRSRTVGPRLSSLLAFYIRPRPVVIVSLADVPGDRHQFPMDLVGQAPGGVLLMALRSTNVSVKTMTASSRLAICDVPLSFAPTAYELAAGHKVRRPRERPSFDVTSSPTWGLPLPACGVRIRELEVAHVEQVGSHHLFTTRVVYDADSGQPRLHHVCGFAERFAKAAPQAP